MCYMLLLLIQIGFFLDIHVFLQLSGIGLFEKNDTFSKIAGNIPFKN
jgi:hypothetical protein